MVIDVENNQSPNNANITFQAILINKPASERYNRATEQHDWRSIHQFQPIKKSAFNESVSSFFVFIISRNKLIDVAGIVNGLSLAQTFSRFFFLVSRAQFHLQLHAIAQFSPFCIFTRLFFSLRAKLFVLTKLQFF